MQDKEDTQLFVQFIFYAFILVFYIIALTFMDEREKKTKFFAQKALTKFIQEKN